VLADKTRSFKGTYGPFIFRGNIFKQANN